MHNSGDLACNAVLDLVFDVQLPYCGNGVVDPGEQCDDGNANDSDYCRSDCTLSEQSSCHDLSITTTTQNAPTYI